jgi:hypothetical protein
MISVPETQDGPPPENAPDFPRLDDTKSENDATNEYVLLGKKKRSRQRRNQCEMFDPPSVVTDCARTPCVTFCNHLCRYYGTSTVNINSTYTNNSWERMVRVFQLALGSASSGDTDVVAIESHVVKII